MIEIENNLNYGNVTSEETKQKIRDSMPDMSGENNPNYGKKVSKKAKKLQFDKRKEWHKNNPEAMKGENNPNYGKIPWNKGKNHLKNLPEIFCKYCDKKYKFQKSLENHEKNCKGEIK